VFDTKFTTAPSLVRALLIAIGAVAIVFGVGMTACLVATGTWTLDAWYAIDNGERPGAFIPHILAALGSLVATSVHTAAALATGVIAFAAAGVIALAPRIASAFSNVYWAVRARREQTRRAVYCASVNTPAVAQ
jgi:hypothetical protein